MSTPDPEGSNDPQDPEDPEDPRRPFDLVICDLDGTLVDSLPDIAWSLNATLTEAGLPSLPVETVGQYVGDGEARLIGRALPPSHVGRDPTPLLARFLVHYAGHVCVETSLYPGVVALLDALSRHQVAAAVLTNKPGNLARALLKDLEIADRFVTVLGDGDGFPRKPDPAAARSIIARVGTSPRRTAVVGDGLPDIKMAQAIPCAVVAAAWGYVPVAALTAESPTFVASSVPQALRLLLGDLAPAG